ncbi:COMM domain-containing protein 2 isoform X1 [Phycodurus eques]|uniref:COMM domain-containing protein 2 isoform X1 n=1 Tax=Phycodurus eques TaxID=693459 RepID=UPI002ACED44E|nr:COMM domain-containing protein 2 isoform X1 [Phycodurus eques]
MLLVLSEEHKEHLTFLTKVDAAVVGEFGRIALEFLRRGISPKVYDGAARKLSVPVETVRHGVEALMYLVTQSSKHTVASTLSHSTCRTPPPHSRFARPRSRPLRPLCFSLGMNRNRWGSTFVKRNVALVERQRRSAFSPSPALFFLSIATCFLRRRILWLHCTYKYSVSRTEFRECGALARGQGDLAISLFLANKIFVFMIECDTFPMKDPQCPVNVHKLPWKGSKIAPS